MEHKFIRNRDIVLFGLAPWDFGIGSNFKEMAYELARFNRVLYVNRSPDRNSIVRNRDHKKKPGQPGATGSPPLKEIKTNLWVFSPTTVLESINRIPFAWLYDFFNKINNKRIAAEINKTIAELSFKNIMLLNDNDFFRGLYLKELIPACSDYIFYMRDFITMQPYFKKHGPRLERRMVEKSDLVVANSAYLASYCRQWNPASFDIGQGCDLENYQPDKLPVPDDFTNIPGPVIGYAGAIIAMRLDISILEHIARSLPHCSLVLVGPVDASFEKSNLNSYANVHFLGSKPPETIAGYINSFDICLNPQLVNQLTIGNYPRKIDEYLALGKPVVATATEGMKMFEKHTFLCHTKEDYVQQINNILADPLLTGKAEQQRRRDFALTHSWENSIGTLGDAYYSMPSKN